VSKFAAHESFEDVHERIDGDHPKKWVPLLAAAIAVLAAIFNLLSAQRSTAIVFTKNEAILSQSHAGDAFLSYESHVVQQEIAQLAGDVGRERSIVAGRIVRERAAGAAAQTRALDLQHKSDAFNERADHLKETYEVMEVGVTVLEISIVLVSLATLAPSRILTIASAAAIAIGTGASLWGFVAGLL